MLKINVPSSETWDQRTEKFSTTQETTLVLRHSLVSLSKWEAEFKKPFLSDDKKTLEETYGYIRAMSDDPIDPAVLPVLSEENLKSINDYIEDSQTATWFSDKKRGPKSREVITGELIYYWMTALTLPWEAQYWHLNRLFTLIKVANEKNQPKKKMGRAEQLAQQRKLNAERLERMGTSG